MTYQVPTHDEFEATKHKQNTTSNHNKEVSALEILSERISEIAVVESKLNNSIMNFKL